MYLKLLNILPVIWNKVSIFVSEIVSHNLKQQVMVKKENFFVIDGVRYDLVKDPSNVHAAFICDNCALRCLRENS